MAGRTSGSEKLARTSISLPESLKRQMEAVDVNWSAFVREAIAKRLKQQGERDVAEALLINERLRRKPPTGWDSTRVIRYWRSKRS
jgi:Arc/MetJ-type ribon-helix-helix transcriptional regulator